MGLLTHQPKHWCSYNVYNICLLVATFALEETLYRVTEAGGSVQVCVRVVSPISGCPIASAFVVSLYTKDHDAGRFYRYSE